MSVKQPDTLGFDGSVSMGEMSSEPFPGHTDHVTGDKVRQFDYLVFFDGTFRFTVPCGVCGTNGPEDTDHAERVRLAAGYGVKSPALRETVRRHILATLTAAHPGITVEVK